MTKLYCINKITAFCHPERITRHLATDIDNSASYSNLNLLKIIKNEQSQFLVEAVKHHHLTERRVRLVKMPLLRHL